MKVYGDVDMFHNKIFNAELSDNLTVSPQATFPAAHGVGHITFVGDVLYICLETSPVDVWAPLTRELTAYKHEQSSVASTWTIQHDLNTTDVTVMVYNSSNQAVIPDSVVITGVNTLELGFAAATTGRAIVVTGSIDGPVRKTADGNIQVDWSNVINKPSFATIATSGSFNDLIDIPATTNTFFVAKNGNDTTGNGSINKPYATLQKAHDVAETTLANTQGATILVMPGTYTESLTVTRPRTSFIGFAGHEWSTIIQAPVTITPSRTVQHPGNSPFSFQNIFLNVGGNQDGLTFSGNSYCGALNLNRVRIYTTNGKGLIMNNTATNYDATVGVANNRLKWVDVDIQTNNGNKNALELQNVYGTISNGYFYGGSAQAVVAGLASNVTCMSCAFEAAGAKVASVLTGGTLLTRNSSFRNTQVDADGVEVSTSAYFVPMETTFAHATTATNSGFAIKGVAGSVIIHGYLSFLNTNPSNFVVNNRVSSAMTRIAATTSMSAV